MESKRNVMEAEMKKSFLVLIASILILFLQACAHPMFYRAKEFSGTVVDTATNEPIEGVVVVAQWIPVSWKVGESGHYGVLEVYEAVTDKDGKYSIPGWGPSLRSLGEYLDYLDPQLSVFKNGYWYLSLVNADKEYLEKYYKNVYSLDFEQFKNTVSHAGVSVSHYSNRSLRKSVWDGRVIKLKKFGGEPVEEHFTDVYDASGKVVKRIKTVIDDNYRLNDMLGNIYSDILNKEREGLSLKKVKHMVKEYSEAKKDVKPVPPIISPQLEYNVEKFLKEELK